MEVAGPLGTPLGLAQRKRASPRGEAGTSGFLCVSDSDRRIPAELRQESQASSCLRKGTPLASRVAQGVSGPLEVLFYMKGPGKTSLSRDLEDKREPNRYLWKGHSRQRKP